MSDVPANPASTGNEWRRVIAALANPEMRRVFGMLVLDQHPEPFLATLSPSRRRHVVDGLRNAGLITDELALRADVFRELLAADAPRKAVGIDRFLRDGRIAQFPVNLAEREKLLRWVADRDLTPGETIDERTITERLAVFTDDPAVLRRYLVDFAIVERRRDGSEYALVEGERLR